jgi:hypothetical protein
LKEEVELEVCLEVHQALVVKKSIFQKLFFRATAGVEEAAPDQKAKRPGWLKEEVELESCGSFIKFGRKTSSTAVRFNRCAVQPLCGSTAVRFNRCALQPLCASTAVRFNRCALQTLGASHAGGVVTRRFRLPTKIKHITHQTSSLLVLCIYSLFN